MWRMRFLVLFCLLLVLLPGVLFADEWVQVKQSELDELMTIIENLENSRQTLLSQLTEQEKLLRELQEQSNAQLIIIKTLKEQSSQWETMYTELGTSWQIYKRDTEKELRSKRILTQVLIGALPVALLTGAYIGTRF